MYFLLYLINLLCKTHTRIHTNKGYTFELIFNNHGEKKGLTAFVSVCQIVEQGKHYDSGAFFPLCANQSHCVLHSHISDANQVHMTQY